MVYLDNSATTKQYDQVNKVMLAAMENSFGNPSSLHSLGLVAEKEVRIARRAFATSLGVSEDEVYFNSGGTEGDNSVIFGVAEGRKRSGNKIITSAVEHPAVLEACKKLEHQGFDVVYIGVDDKCRLNMDQLKNEIDEKTILVSIMSVNNETGTIMPIKEITDMIAGMGMSSSNTKPLIHSDCVQGYGKISLKGIGADLITVSGHKIHGPKGVGGLYIKKGITLPSYLVGGGQERHQRSGTENVPGIIGLGKAVEIAMEGFDARVKAMNTARNTLLDGIKAEIKDIKINSIEETGNMPGLSAPSVLNISFLGTRGEVILHTLEQDQIYVSTGSACSSNKKGVSHVLTAMGLKDKEIEGAIRFSFSEFNTVEQMEYVVEKTKNAVNKFRKLGSYR